MDILQALLCGAVMGFLICFTGVGGGVLVIPAVTFFFGLPVSAAIGTASAYTAITKLFAAVEHARIRNINYGLFARLSAGAAPGIVVAAGAVNYFLTNHPGEEQLLQMILRVAVIVAICLSLVFVLLKVGDGGRRFSGAATIFAGALIGLVMGATGVGGGVLIVPALLLIGRETPKRVVGTSIVIALVLSALTAAIYAGGGQINFSLALWMSAGSLAGIPLGSKLLQKTSQVFVRRILLTTIVIALLLMTAAG